jgi:glutamate racemase
MSPTRAHVLAFDSGLGGLTALAPFLKDSRLSFSLTYFGDLANLPYGTKSRERIAELTQINIDWMIQEFGTAQTKGVVLACNTVSSWGYESAQAIADRAGLQLLGVVEPSCRYAIDLKPKKIVIAATGATVQSGAYAKTLQALAPAITTESISCPLFVPLVEDGLFEGPAVEWIVNRSLGASIGADTLTILGCTHYPFMVPTLRKLFPQTKFVSAADGLIHKSSLADLLRSQQSSIGSSMQLVFSDSGFGASKLDLFLNELGLSHIPKTIEIKRPHF